MTVILFPPDNSSLAELIKVIADLSDTPVRELSITYGGVVVDDETALSYLSGMKGLDRAEDDAPDDTPDKKTKPPTKTPDPPTEDPPARTRARSNTTTGNRSPGRGRNTRSGTEKGSR